MYPSFSVTKILLSETAIARGLSRFSAKIITDYFLNMNLVEVMELMFHCLEKLKQILKIFMQLLFLKI